MSDTNNGSSQGLTTRLRDWAAYPVMNQMDMLDVVLTTVLVATLAFAWIVILKHITEE